MAALDFPNTPSVGQTFTSGLGVIYRWDGIAWTAGAIVGPVGPPGAQGPPGTTGATGPAGPGVAAGGTTGQILNKTSAVDYATGWVTPPPTTPSGPATGDLSGSYPAPQIAAGVIVDADVNATAAIQGTKLADAPNGVTTAKLNDLAVTGAKLSVGATTAAAGYIALPGATNLTSTSEIVILTMPAMTLRGVTRILIAVVIQGLVNAPSVAAQTMELRIYDATTLVLASQAATIPSSASLGWLPVNYTFFGITTQTAGAHTFQLRGIRTQGDATWQLTTGSFWALEFA